MKHIKYIRIVNPSATWATAWPIEAESRAADAFDIRPEFRSLYCSECKANAACASVGETFSGWCATSGSLKSHIRRHGRPWMPWKQARWYMKLAARDKWLCLLCVWYEIYHACMMIFSKWREPNRISAWVAAAAWLGLCHNCNALTQSYHKKRDRKSNVNNAWTAQEPEKWKNQRNRWVSEKGKKGSSKRERANVMWGNCSARETEINLWNHLNSICLVKSKKPS